MTFLFLFCLKKYNYLNLSRLNKKEIIVKEKKQSKERLIYSISRKIPIPIPSSRIFTHG